MNILDDIDIYLPKYLSEESLSQLKIELKSFDSDGTKNTIYTARLRDEKVLFQGDGISSLKIVNIQKEEFKQSPVILLSNTCDMDIDNKRIFRSHICYSPLIELDKYISVVESNLQKRRSNKTYDPSEDTYKNVEKVINDHIKSIKKQHITQILYLPSIGDFNKEYIVFLDKIYNIEIDAIDRDKLGIIRMFTLSNYGLYLFLLKISVHFTRIKERIDRDCGLIYEPIS